MNSIDKFTIMKTLKVHECKADLSSLNESLLVGDLQGGVPELRREFWSRSPGGPFPVAKLLIW